MRNKITCFANTTSPKYCTMAVSCRAGHHDSMRMDTYYIQNNTALPTFFHSSNIKLDASITNYRRSMQYTSLLSIHFFRECSVCHEAPSTLPQSSTNTKHQTPRLNETCLETYGLVNIQLFAVYLFVDIYH
jgi:hypothetical protein